MTVHLPGPYPSHFRLIFSTLCLEEKDSDTSITLQHSFMTFQMRSYLNRGFKRLFSYIVQHTEKNRHTQLREASETHTFSGDVIICRTINE